MTPVTGTVPGMGRPRKVPETDAQKAAVAAVVKAQAKVDAAVAELWAKIAAARALDVADRELERHGVSRRTLTRKLGTRES